MVANDLVRHSLEWRVGGAAVGQSPLNPYHSYLNFYEMRGTLLLIVWSFPMSPAQTVIL